MTPMANPSPPPPWGIVASVAWLVLALFISAIAAIWLYAAWSGQYPRDSVSPYDGVLVSIGAMVSVPVEIAVLVLAAQRRGWAPADYLALNVPRRGEIILAAICIVALGMIVNVVLYVTGSAIVTPFQIEAYRTAKDVGWLIGLMLAIVIFAPIGEEIAFRGFLYRGLARPGREIHAIVIIALAWALMHIQYDWVGIIQVFLLGLVLGWFRWASGSTTLTILMHILINLEAMIETAIKVEYLS